MKFATEDFYIVKQHPSMLDYIDMLQKKNAEELSFYPHQVFEREYERGRLFLAVLNGEPCGYIYAGALGVCVRCHQVCIQYDARLRKYGAALVTTLEDYAQGSTSIVLRCGFDLDANEFWHSLGYQCVDIQQGGVRRNRKINVWRKQLQPELFETIGIDATRGKTSSVKWAKNKKTGIISQFHRGKSLRDYRAVILGREE